MTQLTKLVDWKVNQYAGLLERKKREASSKSSLIEKIETRFSRNMNSNIAITGDPGLGKSTLSLVLSEILKPEIFVDHPREAVDQFVTFSGGDFGRAIKNSPDGSIVIGDEFGQQMGHRRFMSDANVALSNVLQGFRFKRLVSFLNVPALSFFDVDAQRLLTWMVHLSAQGIGEVYRVKHPKFTGGDYFRTQIDTLRFRKPGSELWACYYEAKVRNQESVFARSIKILDASEAPTLDNQDMITEILASPERFMIGGSVRSSVVSSIFGIGHNRAGHIAMVANKSLKSQGSAKGPSETPSPPDP